MKRQHLTIEIDKEKDLKAIEKLCSKLGLSIVVEAIADVCPICDSYDIHHEHVKGKSCLDCGHKFR
tara:strand:+ start:67 stop:264 length:198 start_codon:yes stop_codon:yes gene_type:complete